MKEPKKKIKIGIAGYGFGKKVHLEALKESENFLVTSFYHPNPQKKNLIESETKLKCHTNWEVFIKEDIEAVILAIPPESRFELAKIALENNKHLLLEKPVAIKASEIEELQRLSLIDNLSVCVDFEYRAVPLFLQAKEMIENNLLGKIYLTKLDWLMGSRSDPNREWNWYSQTEKGGGVMGALGTHAFDMIHWFFGETSKVTGKISTSIAKRPQNSTGEMLKVTSEDVCLANIEIMNNFGYLFNCQVSLSSISKGGRGFSLEIYGSEGSMFLKSENQNDYVHGFTLNFVDKSNKNNVINPKSNFLFEKTWADGRIAPVKRIHDLWAKSIFTRQPIVPGLYEGLKSQRVCEAIRRSSNSGMEVDI